MLPGPIEIVEMILLDREARAGLSLLEKVRLEGVEVLLRTVTGSVLFDWTTLGGCGSV
jgi:hypothetical protein